MRMWIYILLLGFASFSSCDPEEGITPVLTPQPVSKTNPARVFMHFMPWFQSREISGFWGYHWRMNNQNPEITDQAGRRQIASHYYPLTGPYDSRDPIIIEYQLLLMKYAGVDGVLIDWYGTHNVNDYAANQKGTEAVVQKIAETGLRFGIVYEEYTAGIVADKTDKTAIEAARADMEFLQDRYFPSASYIRVDGSPLLLTFGPRYFNNASQWTQIFDILPHKPVFLPLWNHTSRVGTSNAQGEFAWVDFSQDLSEMNSFYNKGFKYLIGSAYPGFHDFYAEGNAGTSYGYVDYDRGENLEKLLAKAAERNAEYVQLVTWNDYGEGTMIEPTVERGFDDLVRIQQWTGVSYGRSELEMIYRYYNKRKQYRDDTERSAILLKVYQKLNALDVEAARSLLDSIP